MVIIIDLLHESEELCQLGAEAWQKRSEPGKTEYVEDILIKCGKFRLPSQRQLYQPGWEWKVLVVDVGEVEIERPQKNRNRTTVASKNAIR